jgi:hypothetical protein
LRTPHGSLQSNEIVDRGHRDTNASDGGGLELDHEIDIGGDRK